MTETVVDRLEVIQIDEQQGAQGIFALLTVHRMLQAVEQQTSIGQTGEFIAERQSLNFTLITLTFGNIGDAAANQHRLTGHAHQAYLAWNLSPFTVAVQPIKYWRFTVHCPLQVNLTQLSRKLAIGLFGRAQIKHTLAGAFLAASGPWRSNSRIASGAFSTRGRERAAACRRAVMSSTSNRNMRTRPVLW